MMSSVTPVWSQDPFGLPGEKQGGGGSLRDPDDDLPTPVPAPAPSERKLDSIEQSVETKGEVLPASDPALPPPSRGEEPLRWEAELAENSFSLVKNNANLNRILTAYEKLVEHRCFVGLIVKLAYEGNPQDVACLRFVERLLQLHPRNSIGTCARDGIDSSTCIETDSSVTYEQKKTDGGGELGQLLDNKLEKARDDESLSKYDSEISQLVQSMASFPVTESDREFQKKAEQRIIELRRVILRHACRDVQMDIGSGDALKKKAARSDLKDLEELLTTKTKATPTPKPVPVEKAGLEAFQKTGPTPTPTPLAATRVRRLSGKCISNAEQVLRYEKDSASALCGLYGSTSPRCIRALRRERAKRSAEPTKVPDGTPAPVTKEFETF